jgi:hypothetical protein
LELVQLAEGITVSPHSNGVLERAKNSLSHVFGDPSEFFG